MIEQRQMPQPITEEENTPVVTTRDIVLFEDDPEHRRAIPKGTHGKIQAVKIRGRWKGNQWTGYRRIYTGFSYLVDFGGEDLDRIVHEGGECPLAISPR